MMVVESANPILSHDHVRPRSVVAERLTTCRPDRPPWPLSPPPRPITTTLARSTQQIIADATGLRVLFDDSPEATAAGIARLMGPRIPRSANTDASAHSPFLHTTAAASDYVHQPDSAAHTAYRTMANEQGELYHRMLEAGAEK